MKYAWQHDDIIVFKQRHTKRLVEYKWSDIEKGIYNNGKLMMAECLLKVADMIFDSRGQTVVIFETGDFYLPANDRLNAIMCRLPPRMATSWHALAEVRGSKRHNLVFFGLDKSKKKYANVLVLVDKNCKQIATATIEMESNNGTIIL